MTTFNNLDGSKDIPVTFRASVGATFAPGIPESDREVIFQAFSDELGKGIKHTSRAMPVDSLISFSPSRCVKHNVLRLVSLDAR